MPVDRHLVKPAGYAMAFASICSMLWAPAIPALAATEQATGDAPKTSSKSNYPLPLSKRETVRATTAASGGVMGILVTTTLETGGSPDVADATTLSNIVADDKDVWTSDEGELVWHTSDGRDITYTGQSNQELPVQLKIRYTLDGSPIAPQDLPGKSGHLVISYEYVDAAYDASGTSDNAPFTAATRMLLDGRVFSNVEVTGATMVREDGRSVVYGCGKTVSVEGDGGEANGFTVEADVEDFYLEPTVTVVSADALSTLHAETRAYAGLSAEVVTALDDHLKKLGEVRSKIEGTQMEVDAMATVLDMAKDLTDQLDEASEAADSMGELAKQADELADEATDVSKQAESFRLLVEDLEGLSDEQREQLFSELTLLEDGISQVQSDADALSSTTDGIDMTSLSQATAALKSVDLKGLAKRQGELSKDLSEMLEKDFGLLDKEGKDTLIDDATKLKEKLEGMAGELKDSTIATGGLSSGVFSLVPDAAGATSADATPTKSAIAWISSEVEGTIASAARKASAEKPAYANYGGITEDTPGSVEFVYQTSGIGM